jgi:hypothetical protein
MLYVDDCNALSVVLMQGLLTLEELEVKNCGGLLEVFKLEGLLTREGEQQNLLLPRLKKIFLHDLLELRCIWKGPTQYLNLDNLEELEVFGCNKLKHLFTPILARSLQSLKWLEIRTCDEVEYLIAKDEEDQILSENHLQPLYFPKLKIVSVKGCNKLKYLFPITMADSLLKLTILKVKGASQLVEVFANEDKGDIVVQKDVRLPQICKISLKGLPSLVNFCPRNYHAILPKLYWLKSAKVSQHDHEIYSYSRQKCTYKRRGMYPLSCSFYFYFHSITSSTTTNNTILSCADKDPLILIYVHTDKP